MIVHFFNHVVHWLFPNGEALATWVLVGTGMFAIRFANIPTAPTTRDRESEDLTDFYEMEYNALENLFVAGS
jgi:hypothetical protein